MPSSINGSNNNNNNNENKNNSYVRIGTAVPLLYDRNRDREGHPEDAAMVTARKPRINKSSFNRINRILDYWKLFGTGLVIGIILSFLSLLAMECMYVLKQNEVNNENNATTTKGWRSWLFLDHCLYFGLLMMSHLRDLFSITICGIFLGLLFSPSFQQRIIARSSWMNNQLVSSSSRFEQQQQQQNIVYIMLVFLDGGFLVGSGIMLWISACVLGQPLPWTAFLGLCGVGFSVCFLLILCYKCTPDVTARQQEDDDNGDFRQDRQEETKDCNIIDGEKEVFASVAIFV